MKGENIIITIMINKKEYINNLYLFLTKNNLIKVETWKANPKKWQIVFNNEYWLLINIYFESINNIHFYISLEDQEIGINNGRNKTLVSKNQNLRKYKEMREIFLNNHLNNQYWFNIFHKIRNDKNNTHIKSITYTGLEKYLFKMILR